MGKIVVITNVTMDGVMQSPNGEDPRNGFNHGGWAEPFNAMQLPEAGEAFANLGAMLFGRWTYENFYSYWPHQTDNPFSDFFNNIPKYVVSTTLEEPLPWQNSTLIKTDIPKTLGKLKEERSDNFVIFGSGKLIRSLMQWNLVDDLILLIHPLVLGSGQQLFPNQSIFKSFNLLDAKAANNGVLVARYQPIHEE